MISLIHEFVQSLLLYPPLYPCNSFTDIIVLCIQLYIVNVNQSLFSHTNIPCSNPNFVSGLLRPTTATEKLESRDFSGFCFYRALLTLQIKCFDKNVAADAKF